MYRTFVRCSKAFSVVSFVIAVLGLTGCAATGSRASDYLSGFSMASAGPPPKAPMPPETEAAKPTALTPVMQKELLARANEPAGIKARGQ